MAKLVSVVTPGFTVRTRILGHMIALAGAAIVIAGVVAYAVQLSELDSTIDDDLKRRTEAFLRLADGDDPTTAQEWQSVGALLRAGVANVVASETVSAVGHIDGQARFVPASDDTLDLASDQGFLDLSTGTAQSEVVVQSAITPMADYRYVSVPLVSADGDVVATFTLATDRGELVHELQESFRAFWVSGLLALVVIGMIAWVAVGRLLAPIRLLDQTAREISETDLDRRIDVVGNDDLARLGATVNAMLDRLQGAFSGQRQLLDDAGHELRTPLAVMRTNLELLEPRDPEQVERAHLLLLDEVAMMSRLVDDLVVLAKADRPEFVVAEPVDLDALTQTLATRAQSLAQGNVTVEVCARATVCADQQRILQAWMQLVANAVRFSDPGSDIAIGSSVDGGVVSLWVRDSGRGMSDGDLERVRERFHRVDNDIDGAGLGLPIVVAIAKAHGGDLRLASTRGVGTLATIEFPEGQS